MDSRFTIDVANAIVRLHLRGELTVEGLTAAMRAVAADAHYRSGMHAIADFRECAGNWDYSEMQRFRDFVVHIGGKRERRWAALVKPGTLAAVGHMIILISEAVGASIAMRLFEDEHSAHDWVCNGDASAAGSPQLRA